MIRRKRQEAVSAERKQLEEIAHLYFSTPGLPEKRAGKAAAGNGPSPRIHPGEAGSFFVCCVADPEGGLLAIECLYNLAVFLQVSDGPVLIVGSGEAFRNRFSFQFRPDRERVFHGTGPEPPTGIRGPMDIRLLSAASVTGQGLDRQSASPETPALGDRGFHYILSDEISSADLFHDSPGAVLFVVTPRTALDAFDFGGTAPLLRTCSRTGHVGVVTAGVKDRERGEDLFQQWAEHFRRVLPEGVRVDNFGTFREACGAGPGLNEVGLRVLDAPGSPETRHLMGIATRIRRKKVGLMPGLFPGTHSREGLYRELLKTGAFRSAGLFPLTDHRLKRNGDTSLLLLKKAQETVMLLEFILKNEGVNLDRLLTRYLQVQERLTLPRKSSASSPLSRFRFSGKPPGIVFVSEGEVEPVRKVLGLISRIPVEVYTLCRRGSPGGGEVRIDLESEDLASSRAEGLS